MTLDALTIVILSTGFITGVGGGVGLLFLFSFLRPREVKEEQHYKTTFAFQGNLRQTHLLDAIQFLEIGRREGILHIYCGRRKGYLIFIKGQVVDAFYRNFTKREAVFAMLDLEDGDFYFEPKHISQPRLISDSVMDITFEWDARKTRKAGGDGVGRT
ncbi:MAG TPA: DUF4388 domain-containing protein [Chitinivibrionales bacterium]|nr:DUF4388 domain-containing protein [Chitinivibrionales bacterium]